MLAGVSLNDPRGEARRPDRNRKATPLLFVALRSGGQSFLGAFIAVRHHCAHGQIRLRIRHPMIGGWWLLCVAFMFLFLVPTISYGWGFRGWGPPYPSYIQRRRALLAPALLARTTSDSSDSIVFDHRAWGWVGDLVWVVFIVGVLAATASIWWLR